MVRRLVLLGMVVALQFTSALAVIQREIGGCGCAGTPSGGALPSGPVLSRPGFIQEEPYRNPDMGALGVVLSNGEFQMAVTDMEIPGRGFPFQLTRTYRSKRNVAGSLLGFGWHLGYDEYLHVGSYLDANLQYRPAIQWTMGDGWRELWVDPDGQGYRPFGGFYGKIRSLGAGRGFQIRYSDGMVKTFGLSMPHPPENSPVWVLTRIEDRNGNAMTIQFRQAAGSTTQLIDTITDTLGRAISFAYDGSNRLTAVTDFTGRRIDYAYDATGHLATVKSPDVTGTPNGNDFCDNGCPAPRKTTAYRYAAADGCTEGELMHNLTAVIDGNGRQFLVNRYHAAWDARCGEVGGSTQPPFDFVKEQQYGDGQVRYDYRFTGATGPDAETVVLETTVTDRNGNVKVHSFNSQGSPLRIVTNSNRGVRSLEGIDEGDYTVTYHYLEGGGGLVSSRTESGGRNVDASGRLVSYAAGMTVRFLYDSSNPDIFRRGNLLSVVLTPDPERGGRQAALVTATEYEPLFNQPISLTDPRGHVTAVTYDFQEGGYAALVAGSPPPAPVDPAWWSQGEIQGFLESGGQGSLGDLNGDGYRRGGSVVRVSEGSITHADGTLSEETVTTLAYNAFGQPIIRRDAEYNETHFEYFSEIDPDGDSTPTPAPRDGRILSAAAGSGGGGYLQRQIQDATPAMPLPSPPPERGRESGQDPSPGNIVSTFAYDPAGNVKSTTDGRGIRADYRVNALNQVLQITRAAASADPAAPPFALREQFRFDAANNLVQRRVERRDDGSTSPVNRWITTELAYDGLNRKVRETVTTDDTPALTVTSRFSYDGNGNLRKTIFPAGNAVLRFYDERDLLFREVALASSSPDPEEMRYDPAADSATRYDYDGSGNVIQVTDPEGHAARNGYDGFGRRVVAFDPAFQKTSFVHDAAGNVVAQTTRGALGGAPAGPAGPPAPSYPELSSVRMFYDERGHLRRTDTRFFRYEGAALVLLHTDSDAGLASSPDPAEEPAPARGDGWTTSLTRYDRLGRPVLATDDNGHSTETRYDGLGRRIEMLLNAVAPFTVTPGGGDERNSVKYVYDAGGNIVRALETEWGCDRSDPATSPRKLPAQRHLTTFRYDSLDRLVETVRVGRVGAAPLNLSTRAVYDSRGNRIEATDPAGARTKWFYDGLGRLARSESGYLGNGTEETIPSGMINPFNPDGKITVRYAYDAGGRLTSLSDDNGGTTSFAYDTLGRQTRTTYPDGTWKRVAYDRDSLATLLEHASYSGARLAVTTRYDVLHRMVRKEVDNRAAPSFTGTMRQEYEYDGLGRMTRATDDSDPADSALDSEVTLAYNSLGNVVTETQAYQDRNAGPAAQGTHTVTSLHDGTGFRTRVVYPGGRTVDFLPDALNRLDTLVDSYTGATRYDYLGPSRLLNRLYPNGTKMTFLASPSDEVASGYDAARRVVDLAHRTTAAAPFLVAGFAYGYDGAGNRLFERRVHEPAGPNWKGETYEYDAAYRLVKRSEGILSVSGALQGSGPATQGFTFDGPGNWRATKKNSATFGNSVNALNQYTAFNGPQGPRSLAYDFAGNLTAETGADGDRQYAYDFAGRLALFLDPGYNLTTYRYDALGRRISRTLQGWSVTRYVYDGSRLIEERDGSGAPVASYLHGPGTDEVLSRRRWSGGIVSDLFYHANAQGSVTAVTDSTGSVVERYRYDAFGQPVFLSPGMVTLTSSAVMNNVLFTGRTYDPESRLYDYRARTYHPYLGRFLQRDPLGEEASLNLYAYVFNNPVNATDPTGMRSYAPGVLGADMRASDRLWLGTSGGWSLQRKMAYREGHYVSHSSAQYASFEDAQADEDRYAELEKENSEWEAKRARQAVHDLKRQVKESLEKSGKNLDDPKGILVSFDGFNQSFLEEHAGTRNRTGLDTQADRLRDKGYVVLELNSDDMAAWLLGSEPSASAVDFIADVVQAVSDNAGGHVPVSIEGFSRGGGAAVALTNELSARGMTASASIHTYLIDPYMGKESNFIADEAVNVSVYYSSRFSWVRPAGPLFGLGRDVFRGKDRTLVQGPFFSVTHGRMDGYGPGVLGLIDQHILGY